ncbi:hypothetical protein ACH4TU_19275 [Streptomyces physcomitrii]
MMGAQYHGADGEIEDPSEEALFMLISDLIDSENTFVVVQPDEGDPVWFASVAAWDGGGYELVRRNTSRNQHQVTTAALSSHAGKLLLRNGSRRYC